MNTDIIRSTEKFNKDMILGIYVFVLFVTVIIAFIVDLFGWSNRFILIVFAVFGAHMAFLAIRWSIRYHVRENGLKNAFKAYKLISGFKRQLLYAGVYTQINEWFSGQRLAKLPDIDYEIDTGTSEFIPKILIRDSVNISNKIYSNDWSSAFGRYSVESQYLSKDSNYWIFELDDVKVSHRLEFADEDEYVSAVRNKGKYEILVDERLSYSMFHTLVVGQSGSGKSYFVNHLLLSFMIKGWNDVFVVDPKCSDMFNFGKFFGDSHSASDLPEILTMFDRIEDMVNRRKNQVNELLKSHDNVDYRYFGLNPIILVFDEYLSFQGIVKRQKKEVRDKLENTLSTLILEGRQIGVFVVISMQKSGADSIPTEWRNQLKFKLLLGHSEDTDYKTTFGTDKPPKRLLGAGQGWYKLSGSTMMPKYVETPKIRFQMMKLARKLSREMQISK